MDDAGEVFEDLEFCWGQKYERKTLDYLCHPDRAHSTRSARSGQAPRAEGSRMSFALFRSIATRTHSLYQFQKGPGGEMLCILLRPLCAVTKDV